MRKLVIAHFFIERRTNPLGDPADRLPFNHHGVDEYAAVFNHDIIQNFNASHFRIDRDQRCMCGITKRTGIDTGLITDGRLEADRINVWRQELRVPTGASVQHALSVLDHRLFPEGLQVSEDFLAVYGRRVRFGDSLHAHDRIELLRPLTRDPKDTRRLRAADNPLKKPAR